MTNRAFRMGARGAALLTASALTLGAGGALAHEEAVADGTREDNKHLLHAPDATDGHIPPTENYGFTLVGHDALGGVASGAYTDVWAHEGFAYVGTFQEPACTRAGVYISDIRDPANPTTVNQIKSPPGTRINDVKVHRIGDRDVLAMTLEPCGPFNGNSTQRQGKGGISFYDVSDPTNPNALKQNFLNNRKSAGIHNTFFWDDGNRTYLLAVDDGELNDLYVVDMTKPQRPRVIAQTGISDWLALEGQPATYPQIADDGQLFTGVFAASLLHDIWVNEVNGAPQAVLSYWDAGFVTVDLSDPANPTVLGDSTYPAVDPIFGISPMEGNAHAAVYGGPNFDKIFGGDEDFDPLQGGVFAGGAFYPASQGSDVPQVGPGADVESVMGGTVYVGQACNSTEAVPAGDGTQIAVARRGTCSFTEKLANVEGAGGYQALIVVNDGLAADRCGGVSMLIQGSLPALFLPNQDGRELLGLDAAVCETVFPEIGALGQDATIDAQYDGWGYMHVLNNVMGDVTVSAIGMDTGTTTVGYLGHIGYYAPAEATDPDLAIGAGDLTMHNLEIDPDLPDRSFISWYSAGMRAVEYREGHYHNNTNGEGVVAWNVHEVGRWVAKEGSYDDVATDIDPMMLEGSNFWGVTLTEIDGEQYVLGSDRNTGLHIFSFECVNKSSEDDVLYCDPAVMPGMGGN